MAWNVWFCDDGPLTMAKSVWILACWGSSLVFSGRGAILPFFIVPYEKQAGEMNDEISPISFQDLVTLPSYLSSKALLDGPIL